MKTIDLSDSTWIRLQQLAIPLEDTADTVVKRLLDEHDRSTTVPHEPPPPPLPTTLAAAAAPRSAPSGTYAATKRRRRPHTDVVLRSMKKIGPGTAVAVTFDRLPPGADADDKRYTARFGGDGKHVVWDFDGQEYSISELSLLLAQRHGVKGGRESENGFRVFGLLSNRNENLEDMRKRLEGRG